MAYHAKNMDTSPDASYQVAELPPHGLAKSIPARPLMISHTHHAALPTSQIGKEFSTIQESHIQAVNSLSMVSTLMPSISTTHGTALKSVPVTSAPLGLQQMGHLILQSPKMEEGQRDQERRIRREIANSNERRRMQSINAGFKTLKTILPHTDGEKLSKAAILQQTSEYITQLESDKLKLMHQNEKLRRAYADCKCNSPKHRALVCDIFDKDEGIGSPAEEDFEDMRRGIIEVRQQLDKERRMRMLYEEQIRSLEAQVYPDKFPRFQAAGIRRSSSDELHSSSEYSPGTAKQEMQDSAKILPCARPLLPPLTPLQSRVTSAEPTHVPTHVPQPPPPQVCKVSEPSPNYQGDILATSTVKVITTPSEPATSQKDLGGMAMPPSAPLKQDARKPQQSNPVMVFSHSTQSNQPLKKRAIEVHQNFAEASDQSLPQQPKCKVAKIASDPPAEIGTRYFLPPTLPPISLGMLKLQPQVVSALPMPQAGEHVTPQPTQNSATLHRPVIATVPPTLTMPPMTAAITGHPRVSVSTVPCRPVLQTKSPDDTPRSRPVATKVAFTPLPVAVQGVVTPNSIMAVSPQARVTHSAQQHIEGINSFVPQSSVTEQVTLAPSAYMVMQSGHHRDGTLPALSATEATSPLYLSTEGVRHRVAADVPRNQQASERPIVGSVTVSPSTSKHSHLVVAPVSINQRQGTVLLNTAPPRRDESTGLSLQVVYSQQHSTAAVTQEALSQSAPLTMVARPAVRSDTSRVAAVSCGPLRVTSQAHAFQCSNLPRLQNSLQKMQGAVNPQLSKTVLCYHPPEITLNQLNAVPNLLPPPRSLHQSLILSAAPSLAQAPCSSSPSYISPALQEAVTAPALPVRYPNFPEVRRRKSSVSATDSCSTASISGAEEEEMKNPLLDDPDCQSEDSVPTIKLCASESRTTSSSRRTSRHSASEVVPDAVAALNEVPQDGAVLSPTDVPDSGNRSPPTSKNTTLSVLSGVAGSPPVIRRIDAIQTRRNLETIVQAIDHLEQQERRNSQDHSVSTSSPEPAQ